MNLSRLTADLAIISKLPDSPTETAAALKAKFDEGAVQIGNYLNETLLPEVEEALALIDGKMENIDIPAVNNTLDSEDEAAALSAACGKALSEQVGEVKQEMAECKTELKEQADALDGFAVEMDALTASLAATQAKITCGTALPTTANDGDLFVLY